ncbi:MAG: biopolymer transporter ExbD [Oceanospirillales bacterium]|uniref:Biopolymer transport protein ExbD n=1 Tax=Marinobacterium halophilum TaxID=267374 RepID=A0A2P8F098_9GAMM|nr:biopolymer transporter ExbD [Marinobacterium halophilum]MBR9829451.1 biopolymer transporter ExbD [Oceanospirillales bacterium]PSL15145.1 biopolymer transport protein ExbD [Marinobacterium halophilum]
MKFQRQRREEISINLTPLIDVVFLLLIFFMITTTFTQESHLSISLPDASSEPRAVAAETDSIDVVVGTQGQYSVNGQPLVTSDAATLKRAVVKLTGEQRDIPFIITADAAASHQSVVTVMDVAGQLGFKQLSIATRKTAE